MCPYDGCDNEITEDFINGLSKELGQAYLYAKQFISPNLRRCVGKDCDKFLEGSTENPHLICECGGEVCFNCGAEWHPNYTCEQVNDPNHTPQLVQTNSLVPRGRIEKRSPKGKRQTLPAM